MVGSGCGKILPDGAGGTLESYFSSKVLLVK